MISIIILSGDNMHNIQGKEHKNEGKTQERKENYAEEKSCRRREKKGWDTKGGSQAKVFHTVSPVSWCDLKKLLIKIMWEARNTKYMWNTREAKKDSQTSIYRMEKTNYKDKVNEQNLSQAKEETVKNPN